MTNIEYLGTILAICCQSNDNFFAVSLIVLFFISVGVTRSIQFSE